MRAPALAKKESSIDTLPLEERIRRRAYELYILRSNESGSELDDWLQAEEFATPRKLGTNADRFAAAFTRSIFHHLHIQGCAATMR